MAMAFAAWRPLFLLAGALIIAGGPMHPGGTMAEMLADPSWVPCHTLVLAGFLALLVGLALYPRAVLPDRTRRWLRWATVGTALQTLEMAVHTAAVVDHANLVAGRATPVLTTHLVLAVICYPIFGITMAGLIVAGARDRVLASRWVAWLGVAGALAHGAAPPVVLGTGSEWARILFPCVMLLALWLVLAAVWPRSTARVAAESLGGG